MLHDLERDDSINHINKNGNVTYFPTCYNVLFKSSRRNLNNIQL